MPDDPTQGCVAAAKGPVLKDKDLDSDTVSPPKEEVKMSVFVGHEAPDFEASAFHEGGFKNVKLSDFRGKWVFLCFYPGDFTFV